MGSLVDDGARPMIDLFVRDGDDVLQRFRAGRREVELVMPAARWLDFVPLVDASAEPARDTIASGSDPR